MSVASSRRSTALPRIEVLDWPGMPQAGMVSLTVQISCLVNLNLSAQSTGYRSRSFRAITIFWISLVPSPMIISGVSRK